MRGSITRGIAPAACAVAMLIGLAFAVAACGGDAGTAAESSDPFEGVPVVSGKPGLTQSQEQEVFDLLETDELAQDFLADRSYEIKQLGPWTERDDRKRRRFVGSSLILSLSEPADFEMRDWPVVDYGVRGEGADTTGIHYERESMQFAADNVRRLMINVDLNIDRVVGIQPFGERVDYTLSEELQEQVEAVRDLEQ